MGQKTTFLAALCALWPIAGHAAPIGYSITITTAYAASDPFPNQINDVWTEPDTGYIQIANTGDTIFSGVVGTIAVSNFAGDLSGQSGIVVLGSGATVSVAIPDRSRSAGGFNGAYDWPQPGIEIYLDGTISDGTSSETVALMVADADIHSGVPFTDQHGAVSDSYVLQGGDPLGLDNDAISDITGQLAVLNLADGVFTFTETVPEPGTQGMLATASLTLIAVRRRLRPHRV